MIGPIQGKDMGKIDSDQTTTKHNQSETECLWVRSRNCGCLVTWFCYQLIAKPGNKTATVSWPDPYYLRWTVNKSMGWCKKDITPLLTHWSYIFLALTHRNVHMKQNVEGYYCETNLLLLSFTQVFLRPGMMRNLSVNSISWGSRVAAISWVCLAMRNAIYNNTYDRGCWEQAVLL